MEHFPIAAYLSCMNGPLAQLVSLVSYGNETIKTGKADPAYNSNEIFKFCGQVSFKTYKEGILSKKKTINAGNDPVEWFQFLKKDGCRKLRVTYQHSKDQEKYKDFQLAGFVGGGGDWLIETIYEKHSDFWYAHWNFEKAEQHENSLWRVEYEAVARKKKTIGQQLQLEPAKDELLKALKVIEAFASAEQLNDWAEWFRKALEALQSNNPASFYPIPDMVVEKNYSLTALQLLYGAAQAWVFGGMGSWNDVGFEKAETTEYYHQLTGDLYEAVLKAIVAGINSY